MIQLHQKTLLAYSRRMPNNREPTAETHFARRLRRRQTPTEAALWSIVRRKQLFGLKFRRQHPIAGFVVDFYCPALKLVIEVEGEIHSQPEQLAWDRERGAVLRRIGLHVIRLANEDATEENLRRVVAAYRPPPP